MLKDKLKTVIKAVGGTNVKISDVLKHRYLIQIFSLYAKSFGQKMSA